MGVNNNAGAMGGKTVFQISHGFGSARGFGGVGSSSEGGQKEIVDVGELGIDVDVGKILRDLGGGPRVLIPIPPPAKNWLGLFGVKQTGKSSTHLLGTF